MLVLNIPETDGVPVSVEGLQVLLIVDSLSAACTHRQTSSSCGNSNTPSQRMNQRDGTKCAIVCPTVLSATVNPFIGQGEATAADVRLRQSICWRTNHTPHMMRQCAEVQSHFA